MYKERKLNTITNEDYFMSLYPSFFFLSSMKVSRLWLGSIVTNFTQVKVWSLSFELKFIHFPFKDLR